jgi:hypothetical protein
MDTNKSQYPEIPANTKTVIHTVSILPLPVIMGILMFFGASGDGIANQMIATVTGFLMLAIAITFFYYLAGGFDWNPEKLSTIRGSYSSF